MIVPGGEYTRRRAQRLIAGLGPQLRVGRPQLCRIAGVGIHVVAEQNEYVGLLGDDMLPDRLHAILAQAGAERDARRRGLFGRSAGHQQDRKSVV